MYPFLGDLLDSQRAHLSLLGGLTVLSGFHFQYTEARREFRQPSKPVVYPVTGLFRRALSGLCLGDALFPGFFFISTLATASPRSTTLRHSFSAGSSCEREPCPLFT